MRTMSFCAILSMWHLLNMKKIIARYCSRIVRNGTLFVEMFMILMDVHTAGSICWLEVFRARHFPLQESSSGRRTNETIFFGRFKSSAM